MELLRVQFGCGGNRICGWENHDSEVDIRRKLPYENDTVDFILAEHVVEHVSPSDGLSFLDECHRILKTGGIVRICVPTLVDIRDREKARNLIQGHGHLNLFTFQSLNQMLWCAGFHNVYPTERKDCDNHWRAIGKEQDDLETLRLEAVK